MTRFPKLNQETSHHSESSSSHPGKKGRRFQLACSRVLKSRQWWLSLGISIGIGGGAIALYRGWQQVDSDLPKSVETVLTYARPNTWTIQAADGTVLQQVGPLAHEPLKSWQLPETLVQAFIASEDRRFYEHHGVDYLGIARATYANVRARNVVEGGSTITQQLARMVFLDQERSLIRKLREILLAQQIEQTLSKEQILERYLNLVYFGAGAYGVADAAWVYFGKSVDELSLAEAATLAGIMPAPSAYSPFSNREAALQRRNLVLERMQEQGMIAPAKAAAAIASPLKTQRQAPNRSPNRAPYFTDYVEKELGELVPTEALAAGGIVVETTLDPRWQRAAQETVAKAVQEYGQWQRFEQAALVAIDPRNGQIRAMVGGNDFNNNQYNRVLAQRQPGSTFKPFVYAAAIAAGISPYKSFLDAEYFIDGYQPKNYGNQYRGGYVSLYHALAASLNVVAVRALVDVGWHPTITLAQQMGIESKLQPTYSLALGASEVNLLELTSAYGTFANQGVHQPAYGISRVLNQKGEVIYEAKFTPQPALDEDTAAIMTWMLQGVVTSGTGRPAQLGRPVAGKTGTSDQSRDLWFVGYIPQMVAGVWLGNDDNQPTWGTSGIAAQFWREFMLSAVTDFPVESFPKLPQLEGRQGTIEAEPIEPTQSYYTQAPAPRRSGSSYRTPRRRDRQPVRPPRKPAPAPAPAPKPVAVPVPAPAPAPAPKIAPAPAPPAASSAPPASAPASDLPLAPPASRKEADE
ncbi:MAG: transglycosylase domain-containing protein [Cyanophyceae cyanobacterium]